MVVRVHDLTAIYKSERRFANSSTMFHPFLAKIQNRFGGPSFFFLLGRGSQDRYFFHCAVDTKHCTLYCYAGETQKNDGSSIRRGW